MADLQSATALQADPNCAFLQPDNGADRAVSWQLSIVD
jgi:hypothetical protein